MVDISLYTLYSGGHAGSEETFGRCAERWGCQEVNFSYSGHKITRDKNVIKLSVDEMKAGDISMEIVSRHMRRNYSEVEQIRRVTQQIYHIVTNADHIFAIGLILANDTVKGGTGWGVELAKFFNRTVSVFDQERNDWFSWKDKKWVADKPVIFNNTFAGTGTRNINDAGKEAIEDLFGRSFGQPQA